MYTLGPYWACRPILGVYNLYSKPSGLYNERSPPPTPRLGCAVFPISLYLSTVLTPKCSCLTHKWSWTFRKYPWMFVCTITTERNHFLLNCKQKSKKREKISDLSRLGKHTSDSAFWSSERLVSIMFLYHRPFFVSTMACCTIWLHRSFRISVLKSTTLISLC